MYDKSDEAVVIDSSLHGIRVTKMFYLEEIVGYLRFVSVKNVSNVKLKSGICNFTLMLIVNFLMSK